jgi:chromosome segregation ATPase
MEETETKQPQVSPVQLAYLKSMLIGQLWLEANDKLVHTTTYRQNIKQTFNRLNNSLEATIKQGYDEIYSTDPEMVTNILNSIESLIDKIKGGNIDELVMMNAVIDKYNENKEWFTEHAAAEFLRID